MGAPDDRIHTVVSRPGPAEARVLDALAPRVIARRRIGGSVSLRVLEGGPEGEAPVVFLHGRGHAATMWAPILAEVARDRQVIAVDLPGFGHSGAPPFERGSGEEGLAFFSRPIEALLGSRGDRSPVLVGHSLGAMVALDIAARRRVPLAALALVGAMGLGPVVSARSRAYLRAGPERLARARGMVSFLRGAHRGDDAPIANGTVTPPDLARLREELLGARGGRPRASNAFDAMLPLVGEPHHLRDRLGDIDAEVLLLWGEHDEAFPVPVAIDAQTRIRRAELRVLPGGGHSPHVETPERVLEAIRGWLARIERHACAGAPSSARG